MLKRAKGPPRPEKWTERVVFLCTYFRADHYEQLLDFRRDFKSQKRAYGSKLAQRWARKQAMLWFAHSSKEALVGLAVVGKRIFLGR